MSLRKQEARQNSIVNGVESIQKASEAVIYNLSGLARKCADDEYEEFLEYCDENRNPSLSEDELIVYYRRGYYNRLKQILGKKSADIHSNLEQFIFEAGIENVHLIANEHLEWECLEDEEGNIESIYVKNIIYEYIDPMIGERQERINYEFAIPDVSFYRENEELFNCSMVALKGIYITGPTSSIMGNIYAGKHSNEESRSNEKEYGEIGVYGGVNILSTQLGIEADKIVSDGDININGSFVLLSSEDKNIQCYGRHLNIVDGFAKKSMYMMEGDFVSTQNMEAPEGVIFDKYKDTMMDSVRKIESIKKHYDSLSDEKYEGTYRKIITNKDVEITEDYTGIIITPCNVIVGIDVNVEGLIVCGDRIYVRGNNNIVSNRTIALDVVEDEAENEYEYEVFDYLGGVSADRIVHPQYYVIPAL